MSEESRVSPHPLTLNTGQHSSKGVYVPVLMRVGLWIKD
jgi:hypothetical protein